MIHQKLFLILSILYKFKTKILLVEKGQHKKSTLSWSMKLKGNSKKQIK
jgi:hypothetical protein